MEHKEIFETLGRYLDAIHYLDDHGLDIWENHAGGILSSMTQQRDDYIGEEIQDFSNDLWSFQPNFFEPENHLNYVEALLKAGGESVKKKVVRTQHPTMELKAFSQMPHILIQQATEAWQKWYQDAIPSLSEQARWTGAHLLRSLASTPETSSKRTNGQKSAFETVRELRCQPEQVIIARLEHEEG